MRGCNNFCHYCIVPYTRGRERSRDIESILTEARDLESRNYKEITLLGQNVNSYCWKREDGTEIRFPELLRTVARAVPNLRIRFSTSHPKDMSDETLHVIAEARLQIRGIRTILMMYLDSTVDCHKAKDWIAVDRLATTCQSVVDSLHITVDNKGITG